MTLHKESSKSQRKINRDTRRHRCSTDRRQTSPKLHLWQQRKSKRKTRRNHTSKNHRRWCTNQKKTMSLGLEPTKKKNNEKNLALVRVEPMGQPTRNIKRASKSPNKKMIWHLGVELTSLSVLSSQFTSESHHRKIETATEMRVVTEETEEVRSLTGTNNMSTAISRR